MFRPYPKLEKASLLEELSAVQHTASHQPELAARDLSVGLALADSLAAVPSIPSQLLRSRMIAYSFSALEQTVNHCALPSDATSELSRTFKEWSKPKTVASVSIVPSP